MRLNSLRICTFLFALGIGITAAWFAISSTERVKQERYECNLSIQVPVANKADIDFVPEFRDLPSLDDYNLFLKPKGRLLHNFEDGIYRRSEVVAEDGDAWLVLEQSGETVSLKLGIARVKKLHSISWPGAERDVKLSFKSANTPIFALKDIEHLAPGTVKSLFRKGVEGEEMSDGFLGALCLDGRTFYIRTSTGLTADQERMAVLVIESDGIKQVIEQRPFAPPPDRNIFGNLLWAGDLDADGKLDLYFDEFSEKGYIHTTLFLSSLADPGKLVGYFGSFGAAGC